MKKVLSVILILAIVLSCGVLFGCAKDEETVSDNTTPGDSTPDDSTPDTTQPENEPDPYAEMYSYLGVDSVPDPEYSLEMYNRLMEGDIKVAFLAQELTQNFIKRMADGFVEFWEEKGASGQVISADGDLTVQATQIENAGTQGIDLICIATSSPPTLAATCEAVMEEGMQVIVRGQTKIEDCGFIPTGIEAGASREYGWYMADMVVYYMNTYNPHIEQIKVATGELSVAAQPIDILTGAKDRLALEDNTEVVYTMDWCFSIDEGYLAAEEALTYDSGVRAFITFDEAPAMGFNNYVMANTDTYDPTEFISIASSGSAESEELWKQSQENLSIMRGYCGGDWVDADRVVSNCSWKTLMGLVDVTGGWIEMDTPTTQNYFGYELGAGGHMLEE